MAVKLILICLIVCIVCVNLSSGYWSAQSLKENFKDIRSETPVDVQQKAASDVIARLLPKYSHLFKVQINTSFPANTFQLFKSDNDTIVQIIASDGVAACKGFHYYFKHKLGGHVSWTGNQIPDIPTKLPSIRFKSESANLFIYHQNVCTWSYSYVWWNWNDWRKHIDWMALLGISLTIAPIQESIWTTVYKRFGLNQDEINEHFAGVGFQAWQRMGNIRGWGGPISSSYKLYQLALQKQIIQAERSLGMKVALPAFAGHVPIAFRRIFPNVTLHPVECWNRFPSEYCCPLFVDPNENLFQTIGRTFLQEVIKGYGTDHIYFSDPFNEIQPAKAESTYLAQTSQNIYEAMRGVDYKAIWLLQGWMFVNNPFWSLNLMESFLTAIPLGRILILDLQSEIFPQYERTKSYFGQPFIWCMLHNFGGTLGMQGSMQIVNTRINLARNMRNSTMVGVGTTMEGINQNDIMYEFALDRGWQKDDLNEEEWVDEFIATTYGIRDNKLEEAYDLLRNSVYAYKGLIKLHGKYTIVVRPSIKLNPWSWYDPKILQTAWMGFLNANEILHQSILFRHDLVDITRQFLQNKADEIYVNIIHQYNLKNLTILKQLSTDMIDLFNDLEIILKTSPAHLLGNWLEIAKRMANNDLEELVYEYNARNQITMWGPNAQINDYANKQWSGMIIDYYMPRWRLFLKDLELAVQFNRSFSEKQFKVKVFRDIESPFTYSRKIYKNSPEGDSFYISKDLYNKWINQKNDNYIIKSVTIF